MDALLQARGLAVTLPRPGGRRPVFRRDLTALATSGEIVDVAGPSGSGKTTLLLALARLLPERARRRSRSTAAPGRGDRHRSAGAARGARSPQVPALVPGTRRRQPALPWRLKVRAPRTPPARRRACAPALARVGLADVALERDAARLSVGQGPAWRCCARALDPPRVLLLDEPDANLDDESAAQVARMTARSSSRRRRGRARAAPARRTSAPTGACASRRAPRGGR